MNVGIVEAARLAPASSGLRPFEIIPVTNPEVRTRIRESAWNQAQITDCSHLLVFAARDNCTEERVDHRFDYTIEALGLRNKGWENHRQQLLDTCPQRPDEDSSTR